MMKNIHGKKADIMLLGKTIRIGGFLLFLQFEKII
jgi:hypothetical protein